MPHTFDLKAYAAPYEWKCAAEQRVTFWLLPYRGMQTDIAIHDLQAISPQFIYTDASTGKETTVEPDEYRRAREQAERTGAPLRSNWEARRLWSHSEDIFVTAESITVAVDFPAGALTPELRAFADYWQQRPSSVAERFDAFRLLVSTRIANAWMEAYNATRDHSLDAPADLQRQPSKDADPNSAARTSAPSTTSSAKSRASHGRK